MHHFYNPTWFLNMHLYFSYNLCRHLTEAGWNELQDLARRYQTAFPTLLPSTYSVQDYRMRANEIVNTNSSIRGFADGLFGANGHQQVQFEPATEPDFLLNAANNCPLFGQVNTNRVERDAFHAGPEYQETLSQVSAKLGFHGSQALRENEVLALVDICRYEQTNFNDTSPICAAFSVANHAVLEYALDLSWYYERGYGFPEFRRLYENLNCHLMQDLLGFIQSTDPTDHRARIYNTITVTKQLLLVLLGAFEDEVPLTRHNFAQQTFRQYRTSFMAATAANLAIIRYE